MGFFSWLKGKADGGNGNARAWREAWTRAVASLDEGALASLEADLKRTPPFADDLEIEEEMLDALRRLLELERALAWTRVTRSARLPSVAGTNTCQMPSSST